MSMTPTEANFERDYDREMFRSSVFSALWALASVKKAGGAKLSDIAAALDRDKGYISRLFSKRENCKLNAVSDLAYAMDAEIRIEVVDRKTGLRYGPAGPINAVSTGQPTVVTKVFRMGSGEDRPMRTNVMSR